jgi:predicted DNA-binding transcriptional regulator AlpA
MNLSRQATAAHLGIALATLDNWRSLGRGPRFLKLGARVVYPTAELDRWQAARLAQSTAEGRRVSAA